MGHGSSQLERRGREEIRGDEHGSEAREDNSKKSKASPAHSFRSEEDAEEEDEEGDEEIDGSDGVPVGGREAKKVRIGRGRRDVAQTTRR